MPCFNEVSSAYLAIWVCGDPERSTDRRERSLSPLRLIHQPGASLQPKWSRRTVRRTVCGTERCQRRTLKVK